MQTIALDTGENPDNSLLSNGRSGDGEEICKQYKTSGAGAISAKNKHGKGIHSSSRKDCLS